MTKKYYLEGVLLLLITVIYVIAAILFGIPMAVKIAEFVQKDKSIDVANTVAIIPPRLNYLPSATNSAELTISGYAPANQIVEIFLNDQKDTETTTNAEGFFQNSIVLTLGSNKIYALTKDPKGDKSGVSNPLSINYLDIAPDLMITEPSDGQEIKQKDSHISVKGTTEVGLTIKINGRLGVISSDGSFSYRLGLSEGENTIVVEVSDSAGNKKEQKVVVKYKKR